MVKLTGKKKVNWSLYPCEFSVYLKCYYELIPWVESKAKFVWDLKPYFLVVTADGHVWQ